MRIGNFQFARRIRPNSNLIFRFGPNLRPQNRGPLGWVHLPEALVQAGPRTFAESLARGWVAALGQGLAASRTGGMGMGMERVLHPVHPVCFALWLRRLPLRTCEAIRTAAAVS